MRDVFSAQVLLSKGDLYEDTLLPYSWAVPLENPAIDVFLWSRHVVARREIVPITPVAYCHVSEDGALSHVILAVPADQPPLSPTELRQFEARVGKYLHRQFEIVGWGNAAAAKRILSFRYDINT